MKKYFQRYFKDKLDAVLKKESSYDRLVHSCVLGVFLAFSPYLGVQTPLIFIFGWLFKLNIPVIFIVVYLINNPFLTMIPIAIINYLVGWWICVDILGIDLVEYNPAWMTRFNTWLLNTWVGQKLSSYLGYQIDPNNFSFWIYMIGGHVVAITMSVIAYFIAKRFFRRVLRNRSAKKGLAEKHTRLDNENPSPE